MEKIQVSSVYGEMMNKNVMNLTPEQIATMKERRIQLEIIINSTYGLKPPSKLLSISIRRKKLWQVKLKKK